MKEFILSILIAIAGFFGITEQELPTLGAFAPVSVPAGGTRFSSTSANSFIVSGATRTSALSATSSNPLWIGSFNATSTATSTSLLGGFQILRLLTNSIHATGTATSTITAGLEVGQIGATTGTSTFRGLTVLTGGLKVPTIASCTEALETDAGGSVICGTDATGGAGAGNSKWATSTDATALYPNGSSIKSIIVNGTATSTQGVAGQFYGLVEATQFSATSTTATSTFNGGTTFATGAGNVGIGILTPASKLDVTGFINTDSSSGYNLGGALLAYASSTNFATIFGLGAGGTNATTSATEKSITAVGYHALSANTTGTSNTAVGDSALASNTTGGFNSAVGPSALLSNTTGQGNTAVSYQADRKS